MEEVRDLGTIPCPLCAKESIVRKMKAGRRAGCLYLVCPKHKQFMNPGQDFQDWILDNVQMYGADGKPVAREVVPPPPDVQHVPELETPHVADEPTTPERAQARARGGFFPLLGL